ncbi:hypothetical protein OGAPHI_004771 [Ogataea philodendri]|uniref:Uncharacterized protein n=1 Tax=Ogataea philodendri TaxID=1378263 RepID=A0A9P8P2M8_9ASCO|nr:uncharacterized protein OGAPHI_004771 [Ogataea philodendri]KAH3664057.1 hypothetical protein OGAPHI_004771 [Ogataea philodendri]
MIACGVFILIYILIRHASWLNFKFLKSLVITVSHIYSLVLALWLMAHGLIYLPRHEWETSGNYQKQLHRMYLKVPVLNEELEDTKFELRELCGRLRTLEHLDNLEYRDWILKLLRSIPPEYNDMVYHGVEQITNDELNTKFLNKVSKKLKELKWKYNHNVIDLKVTVEKVIKLEDKVNASLLGEYTPRLERPLIKNPRLSYYIVQYVQPLFGKLLAIGLAVLSAIIVESETFHGLKFSLIKLIIAGMTNDVTKIYIQIFAISFLVLTFMLMCAMLSLTQVKIFNIYHMESNQSSDPVSTIFFISYACRLTIPLSYNFLMLLDAKFTKNSSFQLFFGNSIQLISLGNFLNDMAPRLIVIPILLTVFRFWEKVKEWLSRLFFFDYIIKELDFEDTDDNEEATDIENRPSSRSTRENARIQESKQIVQRFLSADERILDSPIRPLTLSSNQSGESIFSSLKDYVGGIVSRFPRRGSRPGYDGLRTYNLGLGSEPPSHRTSSETGISLNSNISFDNDNRLLRDDDIMLIDEDDIMEI